MQEWFALMEDMIVEEGVFKNANLSTYLIPTAPMSRLLNLLLVEVPDTHRAVWRKGVGEPATIPTAPAILNAIARASGGTHLSDAGFARKNFENPGKTAAIGEGATTFSGRNPLSAV